ncbi:cactin [Histomonas meleagridis]|uniref:cactin n=1 Tax=Histomonas meleagridis TaxID=135588 RepID=UPI003559548B|nr:cactin [Histomonas meleagridis]KAH0801837.1 cactin [Histomonas meleagridis]
MIQENSQQNPNVDGEVDQKEFETKRILRGVQKRIAEDRPILFDLFFINSGALESQLPLICASYVLLNPDGVSKFIGLKTPKPITQKEIQDTKELAQRLAPYTKYWEYIVVILEQKLQEHPDNLLTDMMNEILNYDQQKGVSIAEKEMRCNLLLTNLKNDLEDHQEFYQQLYHKLRFYLAISWFDNYHKALLKKYLEILPHRDLIEVPEGDITMYTKAQRRFRARVLQQENGNNLLNKIAKQYFDTRHMLKIESRSANRTQTDEIEGLQYWGDEEREFNDIIEIDYQKLINANNKMTLPEYEAIVYMGHDWNEHNRKRFNLDNLPEATVRGYRFRIFYPSLVNKNKAPSFNLQPDLIKYCTTKADNRYRYTAIVFDAGPPYLPIAFRIVDKKWDVYRNGGFQSSFHNGVFVFQISFKASLYYQGYLPMQLY